MIEQHRHLLVRHMVGHLVVWVQICVQQPAFEQTGTTADLPEASQQFQ